MQDEQNRERTRLPVRIGLGRSDGNRKYTEAVLRPGGFGFFKPNIVTSHPSAVPLVLFHLLDDTDVIGVNQDLAAGRFRRCDGRDFYHW